MQRQLSFLAELGVEPARTEHGGEIRAGMRKLARPIDMHRPMHVVLRSSRARGAWYLRRPEIEAPLQRLMRDLVRRFNVRIYEFANAGTHLHLLARTKCREALQNFLRSFAGLAARVVTGARKGRPVGRFWDLLAYSRVVQWGRDFFGVRAYVVQNEFEALGFPYQPRSRRKLRRCKIRGP
jgi:hypothetical protein